MATRVGGPFGRLGLAATLLASTLIGGAAGPGVAAGAAGPRVAAATIDRTAPGSASRLLQDLLGPVVGAIQAALDVRDEVHPAGADARGPVRAAAPRRWRGGVNLYRPAIFSTQKTWRWCTAAGVQMM